MGSWGELDAIYPPGKLTPAAALLVLRPHLNTLLLKHDLSLFTQ